MILRIDGSDRGSTLSRPLSLQTRIWCEAQTSKHRKHCSSWTHELNTLARTSLPRPTTVKSTSFVEITRRKERTQRRAGAAEISFQARAQSELEKLKQCEEPSVGESRISLENLFFDQAACLPIQKMNLTDTNPKVHHTWPRFTPYFCDG